MWYLCLSVPACSEVNKSIIYIFVLGFIRSRLKRLGLNIQNFIRRNALHRVLDSTNGGGFKRVLGEVFNHGN